MTAGDALDLVGAFVLRMFVLTVTLVGLVLPLLVIGLLLPNRISRSFFLLLSIGGGVLLTFVVPALSYTTKSVRRAFSIGLDMLRSDWPRTASYALIPSFVSHLVWWGAQSRSATPRLLLSCVATLLGTLFAGAIAAYYLRRHDTSNDGAARVGRAV